MTILRWILSLHVPNSWSPIVIQFLSILYSISIHSDHQKHLTFSWGNKLHQFTCLAQGFAYAPRLFPKFMKPVFAFLRERGHLSSGYQGDSVLVGYSYSERQSNILDTVNLLKDLGLYPHENSP